MSKQSKNKNGSFSGQLGFVLAAAGSAIGLGNLWRFPYLAAKDGGGVFLFVYLVLVLTFGYTLLMTDIAIGRRTGSGALKAYAKIAKKWQFLGVIVSLIPAIILTYYTVIGGWVVKYLMVYLTGQGVPAAKDGFFTGFITSPTEPVIYTAIFILLTALVVYSGVEGGIEKLSAWVMPVMILTIVAIAVFTLTLEHQTADGVTRTGWAGMLYYITPDFTGMTVGRFLHITLDAMSQLFFSLSVSMGIMIAYGSYVKPDVNLNDSVTRIEIFDTGAAVLAGLMIIPTIYVFAGPEGMSAGPALMFISLPKVFAAMGGVGTFVGLGFFWMVLLAALTSCVSVMESVVADCMELFNAGRKKTTLILTAAYLAAASIVALGYSLFYLEVPLPNGSVGQILDILDYISNCLMMPIASLLTCLLIGWIAGPNWIIAEAESGGHSFKRRQVFIVMIKYLTPILLFVLALQSTGVLRFFIE